MSRKRVWTLKLRLLGTSLLLGAVLALLLILPTFAKDRKESEIKKPWTGKLYDGRVITKGGLDKILQKHALWLESDGKKGEKADLRGASLVGAKLSGIKIGIANLSRADIDEANLSEAYLSYADLSGADLKGTNLSKAYLDEANLSGAKLQKANLSEAGLEQTDLSGGILEQANLSGAILTQANLSRAQLWETNLSRAELWGANLSGALLFEADLSGTNLTGTGMVGTIFEPKKEGFLPEVRLLSGILGLHSLMYVRSPHGLVTLREVYKRLGERENERAITYAIHRNKRVLNWLEGNILDSMFNLILFEWTCAYGMIPGVPLQFMGLFLLLFTLPYLLALRSRDPETGIWLLLPPDRVLHRKLKDRPIKLTLRPPLPATAGGDMGKIQRETMANLACLEAGPLLQPAFSLSPGMAGAQRGHLDFPPPEAGVQSSGHRLGTHGLRPPVPPERLYARALGTHLLWPAF